MDMSLDDIINKRRGTGSLRGRNNIKGREFGRDRINGRTNRPGVRPGSNISSLNRNRLNRSASNQLVSSRLSQSNRDGKQIRDARAKIIQKNRQKVTDARDKLAEIAKKSDARWKLLKLKEANLKITARPSPVRSRQMRPNSLRATITNTRQNTQRPINRDRFRGRGAEQGSGRNQIRERLNQSPRGADLKRSFKNDLITRTRNQGFRLNFRSEAPILKRSVNNDDFDVGNPIVWRESTKNAEFIGNEELSLMRTCSNHRGRSEMDNFAVKMARPNQIKVVMHNDSATFTQKQPHQMMDISEEYDYFKQPTGYHPMAVAKSRNDQHGGGPRMSQEMLARLDTPLPVPRSMGILSSQGSMNADIGHRIVVSNLQPTVTHEDIKELFEDIGPLLASRVVRPGTAEVIYNLQKDAKKAVEAYHNRQLDGQPMKCMLVNPRALPMNTGSIGSLRSPAMQAKIPSSSKSSVMPDLNAIHKALFSK